MIVLSNLLPQQKVNECTCFIKHKDTCEEMNE